MQRELVPSTAPIEQLVERFGVQSVFGPPTQENEVTIIPVAQVSLGFGYGGGYGKSTEQPEDAVDLVGPAEQDEGGGSGGGAGGRATPRGYIRISADGVHYEAIEDQNRIPLAGILLAGWALFWLALTIRTITNAVAKTKQSRNTLQD